MKPLPNLELINELLSYDRNTGVFTWKKSSPRAKAGSVAGSIHKKGYRYIKIKGSNHAAHRLAWYICTGVEPEDTVDHKDRNKDNNAISNLRVASLSVQQENTLCAKGYRLVQKTPQSKPRYQVRIRVNGAVRYVGCFDTPEEARDAYIAAKIEEHSHFVA